MCLGRVIEAILSSVSTVVFGRYERSKVLLHHRTSKLKHFENVSNVTLLDCDVAQRVFPFLLLHNHVNL